MSTNPKDDYPKDIDHPPSKLENIVYTVVVCAVIVVLMALLFNNASAEQTSKGCAIIHPQKSGMQNAYAQACSLPREDCDPVGDGRWICASYANPKLSDFDNTDPPDDDPPPPPPPDGDRCWIIHPQKSGMFNAYAAACTLPRKDCDPVGDGRWICASWNNPTLADIEDDDPPDDDPPPPPPSGNTIYSLHYDFGNDKDDAHATVAAKMIVIKKGQRSNTMVVSGTLCPGSNASTYRPSSEIVMAKVWGSEGSTQTWLNYNARPSHSIMQAAARWKTALDANKTVWVSAGGPPCFTEAVVKYMKANYGTLPYKNIKYVQHSLVNESNAPTSTINYLKNNTTRVKIKDGNFDNATADLKSYSPNVANALENGPFASDWKAAFNFKNPYNSQLDGSDAVETLHSFGVPKSQVGNWIDFEQEFN